VFVLEAARIAMIFPTLIIAIVISYRTRQIKSELSHNLAVVFWISANSLLDDKRVSWL
jgi:hypothetical protein